MKSLSSYEVHAILKADGWIEKNQRGSHLHLIHPLKPGKVTLPHPRKDLDPKTLKSIFAQASIELKPLKGGL